MKCLFYCLPLVCFFNLNAQLTYIPDDAFEAYLESNIVGMSNGISNDNYVNTSAVLNCGQIDINGNTYPVTDLTGISEFTFLKIIKFSSIPMSIIDISNVNSQPWQILILGSPTLLTVNLPISAEYNLIDISGNNQLTSIVFAPNSFFSVAQGLAGPCFFTCSNNNSIIKIDLSSIQLNNPGWLNIVNNPNLVCLNLQNGDCVMWTFVTISANNSLSCIQVDNPNYSSTATNWNVTTNAFPNDSYSLSCTDCLVEVDSYYDEKFVVYPNPTGSYVQINSSFLMDKIEYCIFDQLENKIHQGQLSGFKTSLDLEFIPPGIYFIQIGENRFNNFKIVKL